MRQTAWERKAAQAEFHKERQRSLPKVVKQREACDSGRSVQIKLSYMRKLPNAPIVISKPPGKPEGHSWNVVIRLKVEIPPTQHCTGVEQSENYNAIMIVQFILLCSPLFRTFVLLSLSGDRAPDPNTFNQTISLLTDYFRRWRFPKPMCLDLHAIYTFK